MNYSTSENTEYTEGTAIDQLFLFRVFSVFRGCHPFVQR